MCRQKNCKPGAQDLQVSQRLLFKTSWWIFMYQNVNIIVYISSPNLAMWQIGFRTQCHSSKGQIDQSEWHSIFSLITTSSTVLFNTPSWLHLFTQPLSPDHSITDIQHRPKRFDYGRFIQTKIFEEILPHDRRIRKSSHQLLMKLLKQTINTLYTLFLEHYTT